ncbi:MAG: tyrosine-type recombinase/integrase, partial [Armatimonadota bacterium]|nr:tyrosine-type recombinase/integrase [Armatimonadota bacterium]
EAYLVRRGELGHDRVFVNCFGEPADRNTIYRIVRKRGEQAGITGVRLSPHTLRHTFAVSYLRNGGGVFDLQKVLGHESLEMSRKYAELADEDVIAKHRKASPADSLSSRSTGGRKRMR